ncbi:MAG: pantoate--beta-alanine ligase [Thermodesulfovibrionales bacterium]|nr:pantoate--beta-alanine ligase [Thermodesulfovibrionales bacterium]
MEILRIPKIMQETSKRHIQKGKTIGFVPTMGALHNGHLSLFKRAREENDIVVASIFVNPTQFGPNEDFDKYPRDIEGDIEKLRTINVDIVFLPETKAMYPDNFLTFLYVEKLSEKLCGAFRPGHFKGVATVVNKLINIIKPHKIYFGQKDYQQCLIIRKMIEDLNIDTEMIICPTIREKDGLAMSSRNAYLKEKERVASALIYKTLVAVSDLIKSNKHPLPKIKEQMLNMLKEEPLFSEIQYASIYDTETLEELTELKKNNLVAIAVKIGDARLIDNIIIEIN